MACTSGARPNSLGEKTIQRCHAMRLPARSGFRTTGRPVAQPRSRHSDRFVPPKPEERFPEIQNALVDSIGHSLAQRCSTAGSGVGVRWSVASRADIGKRFDVRCCTQRLQLKKITPGSLVISGFGLQGIEQHLPGRQHELLADAGRRRERCRSSSLPRSRYHHPPRVQQEFAPQHLLASLTRPMTSRMVAIGTQLVCEGKTRLVFCQTGPKLARQDAAHRHHRIPACRGDSTLSSVARNQRRSIAGRFQAGASSTLPAASHAQDLLCRLGRNILVLETSRTTRPEPVILYLDWRPRRRRRLVGVRRRVAAVFLWLWLPYGPKSKSWR